MAGGQLSGFRFKLPPSWLHTTSDELDVIEIPQAGAAVHVRSLEISNGAAGNLPLLEIAQARLSDLYPAFRVGTLLERPLASGTSIEAMMRPRPGSLLEPALFIAILLPGSLVLVDFRRADSVDHLDAAVRRFAHGLRRRDVSLPAAREFATQRRRETRHHRWEGGQWQVFLCHRSEDKADVRKVRTALFEQGVVAWMDETNIGTGALSVTRIEEGLAHADAVLVMRGKRELSSWQQLEYGAALNQYVRRERAGDRALKIVPVALPGSPPLRDWAGFLGTFNGVEFKSTIHQRGIAKLVELALPDGTGGG